MLGPKEFFITPIPRDIDLVPSKLNNPWRDLSFFDTYWVNLRQCSCELLFILWIRIWTWKAASGRIKYMSGFESIPKPKTLPAEKSRAQLEEEREAEQARAEQEAGYKVIDKRVGSKADEEAKREIAQKRFAALSQVAREELIYKLFEEGRLPKPPLPETVPTSDNVVDFSEYKEQKVTATQPQSLPAQKTLETPAISSAEAVPEATPDTPPVILRWGSKVEGFYKEIEQLKNRLKIDRQARRMNTGRDRYNPLGRAMHKTADNPRADLLALQKKIRNVGGMELGLAGNVHAKRKIRQTLSELEQELFNLKSEYAKLEHLKHPLRSIRKLPEQ